MVEFLTSNFHFIVYSFEIIAALVGIILLPKYKNSFSKYFVYFLTYVVFVEVIGYTLAYYRNHELLIFIKNAGVSGSTWWYTIFWSIGSILFFMFYYHGVLKSQRNKAVIKGISAMFFVSAILYLIIYSSQVSRSFSPFLQITGACALLVCLVSYFTELLQSNLVLDFKRLLSFYISVAIFTWWLVITPLVFFEIYNTTDDWDYANLKRLIFLFTNVFMYTCFTIGLIVSKPKYD
ncbi:hypothetical protein ACFS5M_08815 [Lacinutrix iliipiscaria]|uniref:Bacteriorhodopsin-like protein n=1 Tax=Lacinutrix iliipiscaria TaxID=1230532 RepID=A0ABW5WP93_9FLAO